MDWTTIIVALISVVGTGILLRVYDDFIGAKKRRELEIEREKAKQEIIDRTKKEKDDIEVTKSQIYDNAKLRGELWSKVHELENRLERNSNELAEWRDKYNNIQTEYLLLKAQHENLKISYSELLHKYDALNGIVQELTERLTREING